MNTDSQSKKAQIVYFSHGGGPLPILGDPGHAAMNRFMEHLPSKLQTPEAIIVISAHWEEGVPTLLGEEHPELFYDYYGFPEQAYKITYPAPGNPELSEKIRGLLGKSGFESRIDTERGFDHGLFIPLKMMYPEANIPSIQLSLIRGLDPAEHIKMGKALKPLLQDKVLIIGSGFSFHNMRAFSMDGEKKEDTLNDSFQDWLIHTSTADISREKRESLLEKWAEAEGARYCHPREEHLLPLHVCAGIAGTEAELIFDDFILGKRAVAFLW